MHVFIHTYVYILYIYVYIGLFQNEVPLLAPKKIPLLGVFFLGWLLSPKMLYVLKRSLKRRKRHFN